MSGSPPCAPRASSARSGSRPGRATSTSTSRVGLDPHRRGRRQRRPCRRRPDRLDRHRRGSHRRGRRLGRHQELEPRDVGRPRGRRPAREGGQRQHLGRPGRRHRDGQDRQRRHPPRRGRSGRRRGPRPPPARSTSGSATGVAAWLDLDTGFGRVNNDLADSRAPRCGRGDRRGARPHLLRRHQHPPRPGGMTHGRTRTMTTTLTNPLRGQGRGASQGVRRQGRPRRDRPGHRRGHRLLPARPERRGQDDDRADPLDAAPRRRRRHLGRRLRPAARRRCGPPCDRRDRPVRGR